MREMGAGGECKSQSEDQHCLNIVIRDMDSEIPDYGLFGTQLPIPGVECGAKAPECRTVWHSQCCAVLLSTERCGAGSAVQCCSLVPEPCSTKSVVLLFSTWA